MPIYSNTKLAGCRPFGPHSEKWDWTVLTTRAPVVFISWSMNSDEIGRFFFYVWWAVFNRRLLSHSFELLTSLKGSNLDEQRENNQRISTSRHVCKWWESFSSETTQSDLNTIEEWSYAVCGSHADMRWSCNLRQTLATIQTTGLSQTP